MRPLPIGMGFPVPDKYVDEIIKTDLGIVMDKIFNGNGLKNEKGVVWRKSMSKQEKNIINYIVICINEFAKQNKMTSKEAYLYLRDYKGIEFLKENYEAEHTVGLDDAIDDLKQVCIKNGGDIK